MYLIAEIGINHDGEESRALELIEAAADSGASAVKFQYRNLERAYSGEPTEIGDEILVDQIRRTYLHPEFIQKATSHAQALGLEVGISFFDQLDISDFGDFIKSFDFFKAPSAELTNSSLAAGMLSFGKPLYLSTGCHSEAAIEAAFGALGDADWTPLHCVSNYPTRLQNARLGQIAHLRRRWKRPVGYSSHDDHWEVCLLALQLGASVIERHITYDRGAAGLDHSSSSTADEFRKLRDFADAMTLLTAGDGPRAANQGELMNRQNLGRSYYAARPLDVGDVLGEADLLYRAPYIGLGKDDLAEFVGRPLRESVAKGSVLSRSDFETPTPLSETHLRRARELSLALPVRLHDVAAVAEQFPIGAYEFHLSFKEVLAGPDASVADANARYSVHLPDYVDSTRLMDPFSPDPSQRDASLHILEGTARFALGLSEKTGAQTPVVGSFSVVPPASEGGLERFYDSHAELFQRFASRGVVIAPQWLPPIAWYFGGSVALQAMNAVEDAGHLSRRGIPFCLDICHMLLGRNVFEFDIDALLDELSPLAVHVHLADALGADGEGLQFGEGDPGNMQIIQRLLGMSGLKVIEVWQGHLDRGAGFREAIRRLTEL